MPDLPTGFTNYQRVTLAFHRNQQVYDRIAAMSGDDGWCREPIAAIGEAVGLDQPHTLMAMIELASVRLIVARVSPDDTFGYGVVAVRHG